MVNINRLKIDFMQYMEDVLALRCAKKKLDNILCSTHTGIFRIISEGQIKYYSFRIGYLQEKVKRYATIQHRLDELDIELNHIVSRY